MYRGFWLGEARSVTFYEGLRLWAGSHSNEAMSLGGSAKEGPHVRGWRGGGGGVGELGAPGGVPPLTNLSDRVGPLKKSLPCVGGWGGGEVVAGGLGAELI